MTTRTLQRRHARRRRSHVKRDLILVLEHISDFTTAELAVCLDVSGSVVSYLVARLRERGVIETRRKHAVPVHRLARRERP